jgi:Arylsulfotransferase (ASST)
VRTVLRAAATVAVFAAGFGSGYFVHGTSLFHRNKPGRPAETPGPPQLSTGLTDEQREKAEALMALGYAAGYDPATSRSGVVTNLPNLTSPGINLVVSAHEPAAVLMDMEGHVLFRWHKDYRVAWKDTNLFYHDEVRSHFWKRVKLFPNGDLLAMWEGTGLVKLDRNSKVLWTYADPVHHDFDVDPKGNILVLVKHAHMVPSFDPKAPVLEDAVNVVSPEGKRLRSVSILEALLASPYAPLLRFHRTEDGDVLHTNTLALLDEAQAKAIPGASPGDVLVSERSLDFVGVLSLKRKAFVWGLAGVWRQPHEPVLLPNGHILIFDNFGHRRGTRNYSRALEIDPRTHRVVWSFSGPPLFLSKIVGLVQRLSNGNTLITVSTEGRALEVTAAGQVVWEFVNPHQVEALGKKEVATLFQLERLPPSAAVFLKP